MLEVSFRMLVVVNGSDPGPCILFRSTNATFLPAAFVMGMQPDVPVDVDVVVIAEDGVTSSRYPLTLLRQTQAAENAVPADEKFRSVSYSGGEIGLPLATALPAVNCTVCPAGWASSVQNASTCFMCPPGSVAPNVGPSIPAIKYSAFMC